MSTNSNSASVRVGLDDGQQAFLITSYVAMYQRLLFGQADLDNLAHINSNELGGNYGNDGTRHSFTSVDDPLFQEALLGMVLWFRKYDNYTKLIVYTKQSDNSLCEVCNESDFAQAIRSDCVIMHRDAYGGFLITQQEILVALNEFVAPERAVWQTQAQKNGGWSKEAITFDKEVMRQADSERAKRNAANGLTPNRIVSSKRLEIIEEMRLIIRCGMQNVEQKYTQRFWRQFQSDLASTCSFEYVYMLCRIKEADVHLLHAIVAADKSKPPPFDYTKELQRYQDSMDVVNDDIDDILKLGFGVMFVNQEQHLNSEHFDDDNDSSDDEEETNTDDDDGDVATVVFDDDVDEPAAKKQTPAIHGHGLSTEQKFNCIKFCMKNPSFSLRALKKKNEMFFEASLATIGALKKKAAELTAAGQTAATVKIIDCGDIVQQNIGAMKQKKIHTRTEVELANAIIQQNPSASVRAMWRCFCQSFSGTGLRAFHQLLAANGWVKTKFIMSAKEKYDCIVTFLDLYNAAHVEAERDNKNRFNQACQKCVCDNKKPALHDCRECVEGCEACLLAVTNFALASNNIMKTVQSAVHVKFVRKEKYPKASFRSIIRLATAAFKLFSNGETSSTFTIAKYTGKPTDTNENSIVDAPKSKEELPTLLPSVEASSSLASASTSSSASTFSSASTKSVGDERKKARARLKAKYAAFANMPDEQRKKYLPKMSPVEKVYCKLIRNENGWRRCLRMHLDTTIAYAYAELELERAKQFLNTEIGARWYRYLRFMMPRYSDEDMSHYDYKKYLGHFVALLVRFNVDFYVKCDGSLLQKWQIPWPCNRYPVTKQLMRRFQKNYAFRDDDTVFPSLVSGNWRIMTKEDYKQIGELEEGCTNFQFSDSFQRAPVLCAEKCDGEPYVPQFVIERVSVIEEPENTEPPQPQPSQKRSASERKTVVDYNLPRLEFEQADFDMLKQILVWWKDEAIRRGQMFGDNLCLIMMRNLQEYEERSKQTEKSATSTQSNSQEPVRVPPERSELATQLYNKSGFDMLYEPMSSEDRSMWARVLPLFEKTIANYLVLVLNLPHTTDDEKWHITDRINALSRVYCIAVRRHLETQHKSNLHMNLEYTEMD